MAIINLQKATEVAREALRNDEEGRLRYNFRREIWKTFDEDINRRSDIGHRRRFKLAQTCVSRVLPIWQNAFPANEGVNEMLTLAQQVMNKELEKEAAKTTAYNYWSEVDSLDVETEKQSRAMSVGYASVNVVYVAVRDEIFNEQMEDDLDADPYDWDTSFHAFLAYTGFGSEHPETIEKNKEFWSWYLDEAIPLAYQSVS